MYYVNDPVFETQIGGSLASQCVAVFGASGMLGKSLVTLLERSRIQHVRCAFSHPDHGIYAKVDIRSSNSIQYFIDSWKPTIIVNCSAYTRVDDAEKEYADALDVNSLGVKNIAECCSESNLYLIHISTDYVFGGKAHETREKIPFEENEITSPIGVYGYSKFIGEEFIRSIHSKNSLIIRTSWLHGAGGKNFIDTMAKLLMERSELRVVSDQTGSLTWTPWLSGIILSLAARNINGTIHASASDQGTWYDVARYVGQCIGSECRILPQTTLESGRPAPRPEYSKMSTDALSRVLSIKVPSWREFVELHLGAHEVSNKF
ncbi:MAG TPA: dTDP-4-dehydrorhamnose reductase [Oligoflexia bacterium]|nr:dTDP-4-dehydrorhamnose reductase [Oligoflexia bacterium]HMP49157.1 dTDP-4-dehydrorhamnose reductase [Oligoflexia bacterium]